MASVGEPSGPAGLAPRCGEQDEQRVRGKSSRFGGEIRDVAVALLVKVEFIETVYSTTRNSSPLGSVGSLYHRGPEGGPVAE